MTRRTANLTVEFKGAIMATSSKVISSQRDGEDKLREVLGEAAEPLIANRRKRDGDKAHITLVSPPDVKKAIAALVESNPDISKGEAERRIKAITAEGVQDNFRVEGIGKAEAGGKLAYFLVVNWPGGSAFRDTLGIAPGGQDFHITLGFGDGGDVHGVPKDRVLDESQLAMKQASLRSKVIRLAHANPELRNHLLPLLKQAAYGFRSLGVMPRSSYLPKDNDTLAQMTGAPEGLEIYTYEVRRDGQLGTIYYGVAFAGKAQKPLWNYAFPSVGKRDAEIQSTVESYTEKQRRIEDSRETRKQFKHGLQVGDIFYSSWGYDQTNVNWYQIVGVPTEKMVLLREVASKLISSDGSGSDMVTAVPGKFVGGEILKRIPRGSGDTVIIKVDSVSSAYKWDGRPKRETSSGWGH